MKILVCADRDGTINFDEDYYLGQQENWKELVMLLPGVVEGIKLLNSIEECGFFVLTNQSSVALGHFDEEKMKEVNDYIISLIHDGDAKISGTFMCPYVDSKYAEKKGIKGMDYVDDSHPDIKPRTGMIDRALEQIGGADKIYMIGDRLSDVMVGLNSGGKSVLVPAWKTEQLGDVEKVKEMMKQNEGRIYIADDFLEACQWIKKDAGL